MRKRRRTEGPGDLNLGAAIARGFLIGGAAFLISVAIAAFALVSYAKSYLKSTAFREKVAGEVSKLLKAKASLEPVQWEGSSAFTNRFTATGYQDAAFGTLELAGFRAELDLSSSQFRRGVWKVPEVVINQADLDLGPKAKLAGPYPTPEAKASTIEAPAPPRKKESLLSSLIPNRMELDSVRISNFNLVWPEDNRVAQAVGVQTVITPTQDQKAYHIDARGGSIQRPGQEKIDIDRVDFRFKEGGFYVSNATFRTQKGAEIRVEGDVLPGRDAKPGTLLLRAVVERLKAEDVVSPAWSQRVKGDIKVDAKIEGDPGKPDQVAQTGVITLDKGVIESFPLLETLATYTGNERFRRIALRDGAQAHVRRLGKQTVIDRIDVQSDGLARLTGSIQIDDKALSGKLRLGIIPGTASWLPGAEQKVFVSADSGYLWTDIVLSGTVDHPQNDLIPKLAAAGVNTAVETAVDTLKNPAALRDSVEGAVGVGRDFLNGFLGR